MIGPEDRLCGVVAQSDLIETLLTEAAHRTGTESSRPGPAKRAQPGDPVPSDLAAGLA